MPSDGAPRLERSEDTHTHRPSPEQASTMPARIGRSDCTCGCQAGEEERTGAVMNRRQAVAFQRGSGIVILIPTQGWSAQPASCEAPFLV